MNKEPDIRIVMFYGRLLVNVKRGINVESYFLMLAVVFLFVGLIATPKLIASHLQNKQMISLERMHSREISEALTGKKIDWDN